MRLSKRLVSRWVYLFSVMIFNDCLCSRIWPLVINWKNYSWGVTNVFYMVEYNFKITWACVHNIQSHSKKQLAKFPAVLYWLEPLTIIQNILATIYQHSSFVTATFSPSNITFFLSFSISSYNQCWVNFSAWKSGAGVATSLSFCG